MRLLFISNVFPNPREPSKGTFNREMIRALATHHSIHVISPIAWLDAWRKKPKTRPSGPDALGDVTVSHPRYYYTPKILRKWYGSFLWRSIRRHCRRVIADHRPDAVLSYWAHPDGEAAVRAARMAGIPAIVMVGGSDVLLLTQSAARRRRILDVLAAADGVVTVSHDLRLSLERFGVDLRKVRVVYRGVDFMRFSPGDQNAARRRLDIPTTSRMLLWVGRMVPVKGLDLLLGACEMLKQQRFDHSVYLVGDGPLRRFLEAEATARELPWNFVGGMAHSDLADWYRAADVTVLPSCSEGVPNVLRESQACGTPFVASRVGGIPEIADPHRDRMVTPGDAMALALALEEALTADRGGLPPAEAPASWTESAGEITEFLDTVVLQHEKSAAPVPRDEHPSWMRQVTRRVMAAALPRGLFLVRGPASSNAVCLTFDDGPHAEDTPRLLDALKSNGVRATFFVVGERAAKYPELVRRIADEGHVIGHHSYTHSDPGKTSANQLLDEVLQTQDLLARLVGRKSNLFRPPWGKLTFLKFWKLARGGYTVVLWNKDPKDYASRSADQVRAWFARRSLKAGDVVLMHDTHPHAADVVPELATRAKSVGLAFGTVDEWVK